MPTNAVMSSVDTRRRASERAVAWSWLSLAYSVYWRVTPSISLLSLNSFTRASTPTAAPGNWAVIPIPATLTVTGLRSTEPEGAAVEVSVLPAPSLDDEHAPSNRAPASASATPPRTTADDFDVNGISPCRWT